MSGISTSVINDKNSNLHLQCHWCLPQKERSSSEWNSAAFNTPVSFLLWLVNISAVHRVQFLWEKTRKSQIEELSHITEQRTDITPLSLILSCSPAASWQLYVITSLFSSAPQPLTPQPSLFYLQSWFRHTQKLSLGQTGPVVRAHAQLSGPWALIDY